MSHLLFADDILLFVEVTKDWVECILEGFNKFYKASGQQINFSKSSVIFSSNLTEEDMLQLSICLGIRRSNELGMYLGHNVQYQDHNNISNKKLIKRVRSKLDGWKTKSVSKSGRFTLAKLVINTMGELPQKLPASMHKELDRYVRRCV